MKQHSARRHRLARLYVQRRKVNPMWQLELWAQNLQRGRIRVGFGPIATGERTLGNRKWHIDPIVKAMNRGNHRYVGDIFWEGDDLSGFDIVVILRSFDSLSVEELERLRLNSTRICYNISDNPAGCRFDYGSSPWFLDRVDRILCLNPLQLERIPSYREKCRMVRPAMVNQKFKKTYRAKGPVRLFWDGWWVNQGLMKPLERVVLELSEEVEQAIELYYNYNIKKPLGERDEGIVKHRKWSIFNWKQRILDADIGVIVKPLDDERQQSKPPTKVVSYMSSGLPVVCTPSAADREVIRHGRTGFLAETDTEWKQYLRALIESEALREEIGVAARLDVAREFQGETVARVYMDVFDEMMGDAELAS